jgi:hypothetical protein
MTLMLKRMWLWIVGAALLPVATGASGALPTTIAQNGAPIAIDQCVAGLAKNSAGYELSEYVDFTNISQRTATEARFGFEIADAIGQTLHIFADDREGSFGPAVPISHSGASPAGYNQVWRTTTIVPSSAKILCSVQLVRFDDGSVWHDGDGPAGNADIFTPLPDPSTTPPWRWPEGWGATPAPEIRRHTKGNEDSRRTGSCVVLSCL